MKSMGLLTALVVIGCVCGVYGQCVVNLTGNTIYEQDSCIELTCLKRDNGSIDVIDIKLDEKMIYYENKSISRFQADLHFDVKKNVSGDPLLTSYTMKTNGTLDANGKTFTCQCGQSLKSLTITVTDKGFGNCEAVSTRVRAVLENGSSYDHSQGAPTCLTPSGDFDINSKYTDLYITFTKPPVCKGNVKLWGLRNGTTSTECRLNLTPDVDKGAHTFHIGQKDIILTCKDDSLATSKYFRVRLESHGAQHDQARITTQGLTEVSSDGIPTGHGETGQYDRDSDHHSLSGLTEVSSDGIPTGHGETGHVVIGWIVIVLSALSFIIVMGVIIKRVPEGKTPSKLTRVMSYVNPCLAIVCFVLGMAGITLVVKLDWATTWLVYVMLVLDVLFFICSIGSGSFYWIYERNNQANDEECDKLLVHWARRECDKLLVHWARRVGTTKVSRRQKTI